MGLGVWIEAPVRTPEGARDPCFLTISLQFDVLKEQFMCEVGASSSCSAPSSPLCVEAVT
jgi:hypothetical protein